MSNKTIITISFLMVLVRVINAQPVDDLSKYESYFRRQGEVYQRWLEQCGLAPLLYVQDVTVKGAGGPVILYLGFAVEDADSTMALWNGAQHDFDEATTGTNLEQTLFYKMMYYFELPAEKTQVRLFNSYDLNKEACFRCKIFFDNDSVLTSYSFCKSEVKTVKVKRLDLKGAPKASKKAFSEQYGQAAVFERLNKYFTERYEHQKCEMRYPRMQVFPSGEMLHFQVTDLCKEVLVDESNPWWCEALKSWACEGCKNCIKREKLDVKIKYVPIDTGFELRIQVDAAYGSGFYDNVRDNGYHDIQLENPAALRNYTDRLAAEVFQFLIH